MTGANVPEGVAGDHLTAPSLLPRKAFYWELHEGNHIQGVRFGDWKAVRNGPKKPIELYDLKTDWQEKHDLATERPMEVEHAAELLRTMRTTDPNWSMGE